MRTVQALVRMTFYMALLAAVVLVPHAIAYALVPDPPVQGGLSVPACPTEDSVDCYWDADTQGNGLENDLWN